MNRGIVPVLVGGALYVGLVFARNGILLLIGPADALPPIWFAYCDQLLIALATVIPGFAAVWLYRRSGFTVGAAAGVLGVIAAFVIAYKGFGKPYLYSGWGSVLSLVVGVVSNGLTNGMGGMAAELVRSTRPPSNSTVERDAR
jgi:hypothetical protein